MNVLPSEMNQRAKLKMDIFADGIEEEEAENENGFESAAPKKIPIDSPPEVVKAYPEV